MLKSTDARQRALIQNDLIRVPRGTKSIVDTPFAEEGKIVLDTDKYRHEETKDLSTTRTQERTGGALAWHLIRVRSTK